MQESARKEKADIPFSTLHMTGGPTSSCASLGQYHDIDFLNTVVHRMLCVASAQHKYCLFVHVSHRKIVGAGDGGGWTSNATMQILEVPRLLLVGVMQDCPSSIAA